LRSSETSRRSVVHPSVPRELRCGKKLGQDLVPTLGVGEEQIEARKLEEGFPVRSRAGLGESDCTRR